MIMTKHTTKVGLVKGVPRETAISRVIELLGINPVKGKEIFLKPNFNTADPFPGSTHNDTLLYLIRHLREMGAGSITIGDRSGPADTADVIREKGVDCLCEEMGVRLMNLDELPDQDWIRMQPKQSHWWNGFDVARPVLGKECIVTTCCLKTHGYGGVFTMSLKLSVGITHRRNMAELHSSIRSMRKMIAEINTAYSPSLILLDGIEAFVDRGPMKGERKKAGVLLSGTDRIAIDAVGLAVLKDLGSNKAVMETPIFQQEQISRAVELELGVGGPGEIEIVTGDPVSAGYAEKLTVILGRG